MTVELDINKIIQDKIYELEENHVIENAIQKKIESAIKDLGVSRAISKEHSV